VRATIEPDHPAAPDQRAHGVFRSPPDSRDRGAWGTGR
jgi:hypothetical protein